MNDRMQALIATHPQLFRGEAPRVVSWLPEGWYGIVDTLCCQLEVLLGGRAAEFEVAQVKEKFGGLRFYWQLRGMPSPLHADMFGVRPVRQPSSIADESGRVSVVQPTPAGTRLTLLPDDDLAREIEKLIGAAEDAAAKACMQCGASAQLLRDGGYLYTACPEHTRPGSRIEVESKHE